MPLRYYQEDAKTAIEFAWDFYDRILLHLGTGGGKTVIAAHLIKDLMPARVLFLADQDELCQQPREVIYRETGITAALEKAKERASLDARVIVASSQTLSKPKRLERFPPGFFKYIIVDEAHRGADRDQKILDHFGCKALGITATPFKANLRDLSKYYEHVAYSASMLDLIGEGFAPPLKVVTIPLDIDLENVETKRGFEGKDYDLDSLSTTIAPYFHAIIQKLVEYKDRFMLVRLPLIKSSEAFASMAARAGIKAMHVDGNSPDRDNIIQMFKHGQINMLCNANLIETGVDIPIADCAVNLSPTKSPARYQQFIGRILRVLPGVIDHIPDRLLTLSRKLRIAESAKKDALIIDFLWQHDKLGVQGPGDLVAMNEEQAAIMAAKLRLQHSPEELLEIAARSLEERETNLVKTLERAAVKGYTVQADPKLLGYLFGSRSLMTYESTSALPPTEKQIASLQKWNVKVDQVQDRYHAKLLMDELMHRFRWRLASVKQLSIMHKRGIEFDPRRTTSQEAYDLIAAANLKKSRDYAP